MVFNSTSTMGNAGGAASTLDEDAASNTAQTAKRYNLGPLGELLALGPVVEATGEAQFQTRAHPTVILDRSYSMGEWVVNSRQAIQTALQQLGYKARDRFSFITFSCNAVRVQVDGRDPTVEELTTRLGHIKKDGSTQMAGAIPLLRSVLHDYPDRAHNLLVVSDGEVHDREATVAAATSMASSLGEYKSPINATLLRLKTSTHANPDTRALACIGSFCNHSRAEVTDVDVARASRGEDNVQHLVRSIEQGFRNAPVGSFVELKSGTALFRRLPTSESVSSVRVPCGSKTTYLLMTEAVESLELGGVTVPVEDAGRPESEHVLSTFFEFVEQQLKMWQLMGSRQADIDKIVEWTGELQSFLESLQSKATDEADISTIGRARSLKKAVQKRTGSMLNRIRQLGNADRVGKLNAQQQADWLRGIEDTRTGRALARRAQEANGDLDYTGKAQAAIASLSKESLGAINPDAPRSFYSLSEPADCLQSAKELADVLNDLTLGDVLQCVGGFGVPFEAFVTDYPDPFSLRIKRVYDGQFLAEPDVWLARTQMAGSDSSLNCPGQDDGAVITGVLALRSADQAAYEKYTQGHARQLFEMQASCQIRHAVATVPYDAVALNAAGAWCLIQKFGSQGSLLSVQWDTLRSLLDNLQFLVGSVYKEGPFRELYDSMVIENQDARPWLSGDRDVSGVLRPAAVLLRFFKPSAAEGERMPHVMRALFYLDCYHAAKKRFRREEDPRAAREKMLSAILGIDLVNHATPLTPLFEADPDEPQHHDNVAPLELQIPQFFPAVDGLTGLEGVLFGRDATADPTHVFGVDATALRAVAAIQALCSPNQSDRIDVENRKSLLPDPTTIEGAREYLQSVVRGFYADDYKRRLAAKHREEEKITLMHTIDTLVSAEEYGEFRKVLVESPIENRQHEGFSLLMERLLALEEPVPCRVEKLSLLVAGREVEEPETLVWCKGNVFNGNWGPMARVMNLSPGGKQRLKMLKAIQKKYGVHRYRNGANRHGHSNEFPSYWALGYKSLRDMKENVPEEQFLEYVQEHCKKRGCCLPNEDERSALGI